MYRRSESADFGSGSGPYFRRMRRPRDSRIVLIMKARPSAGGFGHPVTQADEAHGEGRSPRDWAVDALCFLLGIGFTALAFIDATDRNLATVPTAIDAALGVLASLGLWLRRRWPVGLAVIVGLFAIYSVSASAVALIALFTVAVHRRLRTAVLVAAGYALTSFLTLLVRPDASLPTWWQGVLGVVCVVAVLALGSSFGRGGSSPSSSANGWRPNRSSASPRPDRWSATGSRGKCTTCSPIACRC